MGTAKFVIQTEKEKEGDDVEWSSLDVFTKSCTFIHTREFHTVSSVFSSNH